MTPARAQTPAPPAGPPAAPGSARAQLVLATGAFAVCFAVFGSASAMMPTIKDALGLTPMQVSIAIALPVLLGSLGRIPLGILTDRYGGRLVFSAVMAAAAIPAVLMGWVEHYWQLLVCGFFLGMGLASFSVGAAFVSRWHPPQKQGAALGLYGAGTIGQSLAAFGSPAIAAAAGFAWGFWVFGLLTLAWLLAFAILARNPPRPGAPKTLREVLDPLSQRMSWVLSLYYFLTFGGFVAMSIYLPIFLTEMFGLTPRDAGLRTAGFVVLATLMRPIGGSLADRVGGRAILLWVFPATALMAIFLACPTMPTFTIGALGMAAAIGLGNGAVFKLVPEHFPTSVGSVTGLVGAAGGLGGFFPPLAVGLINQATGSFAPGFILLALFAAACFLAAWRTGGEGRARMPAAA
jgi:NNP family nitrate/nitrite transporter-like MFS transporter